MSCMIMWLCAVMMMMMAAGYERRDGKKEKEVGDLMMI